MSKPTLKKILNTLKDSYENPRYLDSDPIRFCYEYENPRDIEIVGLIASLFAYGNVASIQNCIQSIVQVLGTSPYQFLLHQDLKVHSQKLPYYRFQTKVDVYHFLLGLQELVRSSTDGSLEEFFHADAESGLPQRIQTFRNSFFQAIQRKGIHPPYSYGLVFLIGKNNSRSVAKRYCMFLRWMVRKGFPDFGIYQSIPKEELRFPLDVHINRLGEILSLTSRKTPDWKKTEEITQSIQEICGTKDPLEYDFPLSRLGILKQCKGKYEESLCSVCQLRAVCNLVQETRENTVISA